MGSAAKGSEGGEGGAGGEGGEGGEGGAGEDVEEGDDESNDSSDEASAPRSGTKVRKLPQGSNKVAHSLVKKCMALWVHDAIGPSMGDGAAESRRFAIVQETVDRFKLQIENVDDLKGRLKDCACNADKVHIALLCVRYAYHAP